MQVRGQLCRRLLHQQWSNQGGHNQANEGNQPKFRIHEIK